MLPLIQILRNIGQFFEDEWFDRTRGVRTRGDVLLRQAGIAEADRADSEFYVPARPANIRAALRAARLADPSQYTFVDLGSGKGRALFVAADFPFRRIVGVEFSQALHAQACRNVATYSDRGSDGSNIEPVLQNAMQYVFPDGPLVVYLFNPFGASTMQVVLEHLQTSLEECSRHVVLLLLWPVCAEQVEHMRGMRRIHSTRRYQIFEACAPPQ